VPLSAGSAPGDLKPKFGGNQRFANNNAYDRQGTCAEGRGFEYTGVIESSGEPLLEGLRVLELSIPGPSL